MTTDRKFIDILNSDLSVRQPFKTGAKRWLFSGFALAMLQNIKKIYFESLWCSWASHQKKAKIPEWTLLSFSASAWADWGVPALTWDVKREGSISPCALGALDSLCNDCLTHQVGKLQMVTVGHADYETVTRKGAPSCQLNPLNYQM